MCAFHRWADANRAAVVAAAVTFACACDEPGAGQGQALKEALARAEQAALDTRVEPAMFETAAGRGAIWRRAFARHGPRLGPVRLLVDAEYALRVNEGPTFKLTETSVADSGLNGDFALRHRLAWVLPEGSGEGGRRCWRVGGLSYVAGAAGTPRRFTDRGGEADRCLNAALEPLQAWLTTFDDALRVEAQPGPGRLGRETLALKLSGASEAGAVPQGLPMFWQENATHTGTEETMGVPGPRGWLLASHGALRSLTGDLRLDAITGLPLEGRLEIRLAVQKSGQSGELRIDLTLRSEARTGPIPPPADFVDAGPRPRPFLERAALLGEQFKGPASGAAALPRPGDAPPLALAPGAEGEPAEPAEPGSATPGSTAPAR
jgi:hypothetical protein